jgi:uncharacterized membrane protein SpoIIM required for sporulation
MAPRDVRPGALLLPNAVLLAGCVAIGAALGAFTDVRPVAVNRVPLPAGQAWWMFGSVLGNNLQVLLHMAAGVATFGIVSILGLAWNGVRVGYDAVVVFGAMTDHAVSLLKYAPFEFSALLMAVAGCESVGLSLFRLLFWNQHTFWWKPTVMYFGGAVALMILAAALEVLTML